MGNRRGKPSAGVAGGGPAVQASRAGAGLVEVMIAAIVVGVALLGAVVAMVDSMSLTRVNRDAAVARQAARLELESLQGVTFSQIFAAYNDDAADDVGLTVPASGAGFEVAGLTPQFGDADGMSGRISFPVEDGGPAGVLREDLVDARFGMPRDLNLDGVIDAADHSDDYVLLPVRVQVEWRSPTGNQSITLETTLSAR